MLMSRQHVKKVAVSVYTTKLLMKGRGSDCSKASSYLCIPLIWPHTTPLPTPTQPPPSHTFTWETFFPRGVKPTGPVWFRKVGCQCSLQAHGEPWIMDLPPVWVPSWDFPVAPSPHSCCDWNSQCPINSQWFINGLSGSFRQNRKCKMCQVNGRKDNGAGYMCFFLCVCVFLSIKKMIKWTANSSKGDVKAIRRSLCWTRNFLSLSYSETYGCPASKINQQICWQLVC